MNVRIYRVVISALTVAMLAAGTLVVISMLGMAEPAFACATDTSRRDAAMRWNEFEASSSHTACRRSWMPT